MDQISKFFNRLSVLERKNVLGVLERIHKRDTIGLNIKKLSGHKHVYRVRVGKVRVVYIDNGTEIEFLKAGYRNDNTYKDF